jgi:hypothetical protein
VTPDRSFFGLLGFVFSGVTAFVMMMAIIIVVGYVNGQPVGL